MNKKMIEQAMKKLNMKQEEIDAQEVIIKGSKSFVIKNPQVMKVDVMGQETFQITGKIEELINDEDIKTVMEQANCSREKAVKALNDKNGDLAAAILSLKE
ncbi:MAG: nascent polypeptide-associated complex protein [Nanoarchaeota archaeon]